jgi:hypothetical protein
MCACTSPCEICMSLLSMSCVCVCVCVCARACACPHTRIAGCKVGQGLLVEFLHHTSATSHTFQPGLVQELCPFPCALTTSRQKLYLYGCIYVLLTEPNFAILYIPFSDRCPTCTRNAACPKLLVTPCLWCEIQSPHGAGKAQHERSKQRGAQIWL